MVSSPSTGISAGTSEPGAAGPRPPRRRVWVVLALAAIVGLAWWQFHGRAAAVPSAAAASADSPAGGRRGRGAAAVPVVVATATRGGIPVYLRGIGTVTAANTVTLRTRIAGQIIKVDFREGQTVARGEVLAEIDPRPYEVVLQQASANLAQAKGNLARDEANEADAKIEYERYGQLLERGIVSREQFDQEKATEQSANASIVADKAAIQSNQAAVDAARLNLAYCHITAPLGGRIGLRQVDPGNYVQPTDATGLAVVTQTQPITAVFNLPQDSLPKVYAELRAGRHPVVEAWDQGNAKRLATGELLTIDNTIDTTTGTYRLKAMFDNRDNALFPNQFINVRLLADTDQGLTIVPSAAIQRGPQGTYVFTVQARKAGLRPVNVKITEGDVAGIDRGLSPGEQVVTDGADKLENGTLVALTAAAGGGSLPAAGAAPATAAGAAKTGGSRHHGPTSGGR
jgi:membrane fusion protein, multidrug efflux system